MGHRGTITIADVQYDVPRDVVTFVEGLKNYITTLEEAVEDCHTTIRREQRATQKLRTEVENLRIELEAAQLRVLHPRIYKN